MQSVSSRIWTRVAVFISYDDNHYTWELYGTNPGGYIPQNNSYTVTSLPFLKPSDEQDMQDSTGGVKTNSWVTFFHGPHHTDEKVLNDQLELISNISIIKCFRTIIFIFIATSTGWK